jgi:V/A-type H+/Na+-transporting ATPase subunit I
MLKAEDMIKVRIFSPKNRLKSIIEVMYDAKAVDVIQHQKNEDMDIGSPLVGSTQLSESIVKSRSLIYQLGINSDKIVENEKLKYPKTKIREIDNLHNEISGITKRIKEVDSRLNILTTNFDKLKAIKKLKLSSENLVESNIIKHYIGYVSDSDEFKADIKKTIKKNYEISSAKYIEKNLVCLFIENDKENAALNVIRHHNFNEIKVSEEFIGKKNIVEKIDKEIRILNKEKSVLINKIKRTKKASEKDLLHTEKALSVLSKKSESPLMFAQTKNISIISGWIPLKNKKELFKSLEKTTKNNIHIEELEIKKEDSVPIKLNNPNAVKPYEFLLQLFSMPSYKELDPSIFMFITFPLFFGFMLGDVGYGIVTLLLFLILKMKMPNAKALLNIMIFCSISSIIFGCVYGEVFGYEVSEWMHPEEPVGIEISDLHPEDVDVHGGETTAHEGVEEHHEAGFLEWITTWPLHRSASNAINLIILSVIIGFIHVNLGLIFGFINVYKNHGLKMAILEKVSWWLLQIAVLIIALSAIGILIPIMLYVGIGLVIVTAVMLFFGEGIQGLIELPSIFVHIGSYMRLMAIGLASVGLAIVINEQSGVLFSKGIFGILAGILIFTLGHVINIGLGIIGPFLHSLRLHYVEHFTKFYKGGGKEFSPFGADDN